MQNQPGRASYLSKNYNIFMGLLVSGGLAFVGALVAGLTTGIVPSQSLVTVAAIVAIVVTYPMKLLPGKKALKSIPGIKLILIGACFFLTVVLAAQVGGAEIGSNVMKLALALGFYTASSANLCDIPDLEGDRAEGITTLAVLLGAKGAWVLSVALTIAGALMLFSMSSAGAAVTGAIWIALAMTWTPEATPLSSLLKLRKFGWLTFSVPVLLLG